MSIAGITNPARKSYYRHVGRLLLRSVRLRGAVGRAIIYCRVPKSDMYIKESIL